MAAITMTGVRKTYGGVTALDGIDLRIEPGELVAVLGSNGAGKTTMFEVLLGLVHADDGDVRLLGQRPGSRAVVPRTGAMLQGAGLPESVTVRELVRLIARSYPRSGPVKEVLERVGLSGRSTRMVTQLSGGERQRLLLAMAIVGTPEILLLDEPTAAMDLAARQAFWDEARSSVDAGTTLVFATHDLAEADEIAERIVILRDGRVRADATPSALKRLVHGKTAQFVTDAPAATLAALPGGGPVEIGEAVGAGARRVTVHTNEPERLMAALFESGVRFDDLAVLDADLEDAFVHLTVNDNTTGGRS